MPHEDQFTAVGPSLTGSGFPRAGFSTKASDMDHGVNVRGEKCGVYGESGVPLPSVRAPEVDGIGVHGFGTNFGVSGRATANGIAGIVGRHGNNGIGVIGAVKSEDLKGIGVVGVSRSPGLGSATAPVPDPADGLGIGVFGTSGEGPGVRGSSQSGEGGQFESESGVGASGTSGSGAGVSGKSGSGAGVSGRSGSGIGVTGTSDSSTGVRGSSDSGTGVSGRSESGIGVTGRSAGNRGGLFSSAESVAQIHLVPHRQQPGTRVAELPQNGRVGDLIVVRSTGEDREGIPFDFCSLWLCTPKDPSEEESDQWTEVLLGGTVTGTLS